MKNVLRMILVTAAVAVFAVWDAPAASAQTAPTAAMLLALERQATEAFYGNGDPTFFDGLLSDKFVMYSSGGRFGKSDVLGMAGSAKCEVEDGWTLDKPALSKVDNDTYVFSYISDLKAACVSASGSVHKIDRPVRAASLYVRSGDKWLVAYHGTNDIVDPSAPQPAQAKEDIAPAGKSEAIARPMAVVAAAAPAAAESTKPASPSPNTAALPMKLNAALWEAWKDHDAKRINELTSSDLAFVNIFGTWLGTKADAVRDWTGTACRATSVSVSDGVATALSPNVEILTSKGTAAGTCGGQPIPPGYIYGISVYVKQGSAWKMAFGFNSPN